MAKQDVLERIVEIGQVGLKSLSGDLHSDVADLILTITTMVECANGGLLMKKECNVEERIDKIFDDRVGKLNGIRRIPKVNHYMKGRKR